MLSEFFTPENKLLICAASTAEAECFLSGLAPGASFDKSARLYDSSLFSLLQMGVGKSNAAAAVAEELAISNYEKRPYRSVLVVGIAGSLSPTVLKGDAVLASGMILADEGTPLSAPPHWRSLEDAGFATNNFTCEQTKWWQRLAKLVDHVGPIATISTISGNKNLAESYVVRSQALAEDMEGAAVATACSRVKIACNNLRTISNICGNSNREENPWDFGAALKRLKEIAVQLTI